MTMIALDAARTRAVPAGSLEARWLVDEGEVAEYVKAAAREPLMQALMVEQAKARLSQEEAAVAAKEATDTLGEARRARRG